MSSFKTIIMIIDRYIACKGTHLHLYICHKFDSLYFLVLKYWLPGVGIFPFI
jgi:hypothetical protein